MHRIYQLLHWDRSEAEQAEGLGLAAQVQKLEGFFQPQGENAGKAVWDNCALVISRRSDGELMPHIGDMLLWLQDMNWPGAHEILQRLYRFRDKNWVLSSLKPAISVVLVKKDVSWAFGLGELLRDDGLREGLEPDQVSRLRELAQEEEWTQEPVKRCNLSPADAYTARYYAAKSGAYTAYLRGKRCRTEDDFFREVSAAFQFPDYFGNNWAATDECLCDLEWLCPKAVFVVIEDFGRMFAGQPRIQRLLQDRIETYFTRMARELEVPVEVWLNN